MAPRELSQAEMTTLIDGCVRLRDKFLLRLPRSTGLRIGEALRPRHEDVDARAHPARPAARTTPHRRDRPTLPHPQRHPHRLPRYQPHPALQREIPPRTAHQLLTYVRTAEPAVSGPVVRALGTVALLGRGPASIGVGQRVAVGKWRSGKPELSTPMNAFRGILGIKVVLCRPGDPEAKGLVERANGYLETSFLPGRSFGSPADFNKHLTAWLVVANSRRHRSLACRPVDRWAADAVAMLELPPTAPTVGWSAAVRLGRDHYVRVDANDYSVHPSVIGRKILVSADLNAVRVHCDSTLVATHQCCCWGLSPLAWEFGEAA